MGVSAGPAAGPSLLDTRDVNVQSPVPPKAASLRADLSSDVAFRHSGWTHDRRRVDDAIYDVFGTSARLERFRLCGSNAWVVRRDDDPSQISVVSDHCHDRFCRPCASFKGRTIAGNVRAVLGRNPFRFVTLTIKTTDLTLTQAVHKLYRSFSALRRTKLWQSRVLGGCAVCEVKPRASHAGWHPHLHLVTHGSFLPHAALSKAWHKITGDSYIVDVRFGKDPDHAARYVSKYIGKPFHADVIRDPDRLREAIKSLHGRRMCLTFGDWRGVKLCHFSPGGTWVAIAPLRDLRDRARSGDPDAIELLLLLERGQPWLNYPTPRPRASPAVSLGQCSFSWT